MESNPSLNSQFTKGWSWGNIKLKKSKIDFESNEQLWFTVPYPKISNALLPTKNEVGIEFNLEDTNPYILI
jgi:structure-specific recognition protein 1